MSSPMAWRQSRPVTSVASGENILLSLTRGLSTGCEDFTSA